MDYEKIFKIRDEFINKICKIDLYGYQKEFSDNVIRSVLDNKGETITAMFCRQSGKTEAVCCTIFFLINFYFPLLKHYKKQVPRFFNIGVFAPQQQQSETDFIKIKDYLYAMKNFPEFDIQLETANGDTIKVVSKSQPQVNIYCFTLSPTSHPESKTLHLIIYEESQDMLDFRIDKTASPMGASTNATEVYIGTAGYKRCKFWDNLNKQDLKHTIVPYARALEERKAKYDETQEQFHLNYSLHIDKKKRELGDNSDEFKTQYALTWILERGQFIKYEDLVKLEADYDIPFIDKFSKCYAGIDWGKANDSTILTIVNSDGKIVCWLEFQGDDYYNQYEYILELIARKYPGCEMIYCDATASQDQAVDTLRVLSAQRGLKANVEGIKFSLQSKDQMYKNLARLMNSKIVNNQLVEKAFISFPSRECVEKEKFIKQFIDLQKEIKGDMWSCHHPDGAGYHDDYCDSLALACLAFGVGVSDYVPRLS